MIPDKINYLKKNIYLTELLIFFYLNIRLKFRIETIVVTSKYDDYKILGRLF